jgi:hypothetical protein
MMYQRAPLGPGGSAFVLTLEHLQDFQRKMRQAALPKPIRLRDEWH